MEELMASNYPEMFGNRSHATRTVVSVAQDGLPKNDFVNALKVSPGAIS